MEVKAVEVKNNLGEIIKSRFILPKSSPISKKVPVVIMVTGDDPSGSKSLSWTNIPPLLAEKGIGSALFDFSGLGDSEGERKKLTLTKGIGDFERIFDEFLNQKWIDHDKIGIFSSSFGSSVVIASDYCLKANVLGFKSPCSFLPDAYINELSKNELEDWMKTGYCAENGYDINVLYDPLNYNIYKLAERINIPALITHGDKDEIVPINQSHLLVHQLNGIKQIVTFNNCDHGYSQDKNWDKMADLFVEYFSSVFSSARGDE